MQVRFDVECPLSLAELAPRLKRWPLAAGADMTLLWLGHPWQVRTDHQPHHWCWIAHTPDATAWCVMHLRGVPSVNFSHLICEVQADLRALPRTAQRSFAHSIQSALLQLCRPTLDWAAAADASLEQRYPRTVAAFKAMNALTELQRIQQLDARWAQFEYGERPPLRHSIETALPPSDLHVDIVYAGGGLSLLHAALMAQRGYRVLLFDQYAVGCAHREWNISRVELQHLVDTGLIDWPTLEQSIIMAEYADGVVRFFAAGSDVAPAAIYLPDVLNVALDAGALLQHMRQRLEQAGGIIWEGWRFEHVFASKQNSAGVAVQLRSGDVVRTVAARLMIDGMGATSPLTLATQPFSGVCPTVGTVVRGVADHDPAFGDILISVADTQRGRQLIWEGFPGRDDELTVYVFYYDLVGTDAQQQHSLLELFEDYFALLPSYKAPGPDFAHLRPVYGYIPGRHALQRPLPLPGVLPVGDASAQQSPLTFCGFGSFVRNLQRTVDGTDYALRYGLLAPADLRRVSAYQANVSMNWVFSRFMAPWERPQDVNELQNVFAAVLNQLGPAVSRRFFQDQMTWSDYRAVILGTLAVYPPIMRVAWRVLGLTDIRHWIGDWLRFSRAAILARLFSPVLPLLLRLVERWQPRWAFVLQTTFAEWRAMGWVKPQHLRRAATDIEQVV